MQALDEQMDSVFSHGLCFCIKNALLRGFHINLHPAALCPEITRTGIDLHFTVYHLIIKCLPCFHSYTLCLQCSPFPSKFHNLKLTCENG